MENIIINKNLKLKFSLLQITYWCTIGAFSGFMVSYMQTKGMTPKLIGVMLSVSTLCAFLGQLFWGSLSDKIKSNKKIFIITNILMLILHIVVFYMPSYALVIITFGVLGFVETPVAANLDTWILKIYYKTPQAYGPIRACASIGFAIFTLIYGGLIEKFGYSLLIIFSSCFVLLSITIALFLPDSQAFTLEKTNNFIDEISLKKFFTNKSFIFILIILLCSGVALAPMMQMMAVIMSRVGGTVKFVGYTLFASAIAQVPFMIFAHKLAFISAKRRMLLAAIMYFISLLLTAMATTPTFIVFCSVINGIGFGLMLPAMREAIFECSPKQFYTTAQSISDAIYVSFAGMISNSLAGFMIEDVGMKNFLITCAAIQLIAIILLSIKITSTSK